MTFTVAIWCLPVRSLMRPSLSQTQLLVSEITTRETIYNIYGNSVSIGQLAQNFGSSQGHELPNGYCISVSLHLVELGLGQLGATLDVAYPCQSLAVQSQTFFCAKFWAVEKLLQGDLLLKCTVTIFLSGHERRAKQFSETRILDRIFGSFFSTKFFETVFRIDLKVFR